MNTQKFTIANNPDIAKLILRVTVGFLMVFHGLAKVFNGVGGIAGMLESKGIPGFVAYGVYLGEVVAPILIIIGFYTKLSATVLIFTMLTAIMLAHGDEIFALNDKGAIALELIYFYIFASVAIIFLGNGKYAVHKD